MLRWVENTPEGRKRKSLTVRGTYREACNELARLQAEKCDQAAAPTFGRAHALWYRPWLEGKYEGSGSMTPKIYARAWEKHCSPRWAAVPVDQARPLDIQEWLSGMTYGDAHACMCVMRRLADFAVRYGVAPDNKFRLPYQMPEPSRKRSRAVYSADEADAMLNAVRGLSVEPAFILACFGGARTGESLAVRCEEMRFSEHCGVRVALVPISRRMGGAGNAPIEGLKTKDSERPAIIPEPYCDRLREIAGDGRVWLCDRGDGLPMNKSELARRWGKVEGRIPFSNLRNSWRTFAEFEWGIDSVTLELAMGHALPGVTGRHYLRPSADMLADRFAAAYAKNRRHLG